MGYGFVKFKTEDAAGIAIASMNGMLSRCTAYAFTHPRHYSGKQNAKGFLCKEASNKLGR